MNRFLAHYTFALAVFFLASCKKENETSPPFFESDQMVLVYLAANNDLSSDAVNSIVKMQNGFTAGKGNKLLVYVKLGSGRSYLLDIKASDGKRIVADTLKVYPNGNSADPNFLKRVIEDSRRFVKSKSHGMVLWSHATSWLPAPSKIDMRTKSFGYDDEVEMDIRDLRDALPGDLDYLLFDACSMASMEVCYELKDKTRFILASPAEVLSSGFPYDEITDHLFGGLNGLELIAEKFLDFYRNQNGLYSSATISLIDTDKLDRVAVHTKGLLNFRTAQPPFNKSKIQKLDFERGSGLLAYDFLSFLKHNYEHWEYAQLENSVQEAVLFHGSTETFFGMPLTDFSGLSIYLPEANDDYKSYYESLAWSRNSQWYKMFHE